MRGRLTNFEGKRKINMAGCFISAEEIEKVFDYLQHKDRIAFEVVEKFKDKELTHLRKIIGFKAIFELDGTPHLQFVIRGETNDRKDGE